MLSDRRQNLDAPIAQFDVGMIVFANGDPMRALHGGFAHFVGDRMATVASQTIDTGADQEMRAERLCFAEELVNVVLSIANVNQSLRIA